jgi:hypothetical protein
MPPPRIRLSLAVSLDGFIATPDGGVDWLADFPAESVGFDRFLAEVGTGRRLRTLAVRAAADHSRHVARWSRRHRTRTAS